MRFVVRVLSGRPVIQRVIELYVTLSVVITIGVATHHAGDAQNIAGRIAVIARWWLIYAGGENVVRMVSVKGVPNHT
jgi:hypothetical protein